MNPSPRLRALNRLTKSLAPGRCIAPLLTLDDSKSSIPVGSLASPVSTFSSRPPRALYTKGTLYEITSFKLALSTKNLYRHVLLKGFVKKLNNCKRHCVILPKLPPLPATLRSPPNPCPTVSHQQKALSMPRFPPPVHAIGPRSPIWNGPRRCHSNRPLCRLPLLQFTVDDDDIPLGLLKSTLDKQ
ncbi:hypothetical protein DM01DRAFT_1339109 [Hesseltinella vesiculosa]|uniref:Uncharacterized protein n=1 Tax=Hesseltinella vesiculosa TaxID=101127 RepID=A0A1X2G850_9FUNG|nr:hypothetical protein DM01DRAFT_1339109 [Hesseltinella vesiculosa]